MNKKIFRNFGFYKDQDGIINRYLREAGGWDIHLNKTKEFILKAAQAKQKKKACVLGTGWLLDVPYKELSEAFEEIVFIDIKHPRQIIHKLRDFKNIKLVEEDITGLVEQVYLAIKNHKKSKNIFNLDYIKPNYSNNITDILKTADYVVSVNLLNQLDILICDYLQKIKLFTDLELNSFRAFIQNMHIELLPKTKSALITDYEELKIDNQNQVIARKNLVHIKLPENTDFDKWKWDFDLQKTYNHGFQTIFKVIAIQL